MARIHILGASGSGTTTLGAALALATGWRHEDADAYFWLPTDPPFTTSRAPAERLALVMARLDGVPDWIFSGSALSWAGPIEPRYELVVFLRLETATRMARLRAREAANYGGRIAPGGDMAAASRDFLAWAAAYDTAGTDQRSLARHEAWLAERRCPVLRLDSLVAVPDLVSAVRAAAGA